jgi:hypothetical protein
VLVYAKSRRRDMSGFVNIKNITIESFYYFLTIYFYSSSSNKATIDISISPLITECFGDHQ